MDHVVQIVSLLWSPSLVSSSTRFFVHFLVIVHYKMGILSP